MSAPRLDEVFRIKEAPSSLPVTCRTVEMLKTPLGADFDSLLSHSKELAQDHLRDPEEYGLDLSKLRDKSVYEALKKYGILGLSMPSLNPNGRFVVNKGGPEEPDVKWEVLCYSSHGSGGYMHSFIMDQSGRWWEESEKGNPFRD